MKSDDIRILRDIEQYYSTQIDEMPMNGRFPFSDAFISPMPYVIVLREYAHMQKFFEFCCIFPCPAGQIKNVQAFELTEMKR